MCDIVTGSDKVVTVGVQRPGVQPGRWRLQLGKCAVGALALACSPQNVRAKVREEGGGKNAKIVDLSVSKGGRVRSRIRRQHRACHQKVVAQEHDLVIATWNTQGGNWAKTETRHVSKFQCLVDEMRSKLVDVMCLTDLRWMNESA